MLWRNKEDNVFGEYLIRKADPKDAKGIILCMQSVMDERVFLVSEYYLLTERGEQDRIKSPDDLTLVADLDGEIVGVVTVQRGMYRKNRHTANLGIAIKQQHRTRGLGTELIKGSIKWCQEVGIKKLNLEVFSSNYSAMKLYEKLGFKEEGRRIRQFTVDGTLVDDVLMTYFI